MDMTHSTAGLRHTIEQQARSLADQGISFDHVVESGQSLAGLYRLIGFVGAATEAQLVSIKQQLDAAAERGGAAERLATRMHELDVATYRRESPLTDNEQAEVDASNERARVLVEQANTTEARLGRVEAVLIEIRDALVKR